MFTLGIISDVHGNTIALEAVLEDIVRFPIEKFVSLGDIVGYGPWPGEAIKRTLDVCDTVLKGNHDEAAAKSEVPPNDFNPFAQEGITWTNNQLSQEERKLLYSLNPMVNFSLRGKSITLVHGGPSFPLDEYIENGSPQQEELIPFMEMCEIDILAHGHTHRPYIKRAGKNNELLLINPGSVGQPRDGDPRASYAVVDVEKLEALIIRIPYDIESVAQKIKEVGLPLFFAERLFEGK